MLLKPVLGFQSMDFGILRGRTGFCSDFKTPEEAEEGKSNTNFKKACNKWTFFSADFNYGC